MKQYRLNEQSGYYGNEVKELIHASKFALFFIDENQYVTLKDFGSVDLIEKYANEFDAYIMKEKLVSQFRCDRSDACILQIHKTGSTHYNGVDYDFRVYDNPH